MTSTDRPFIWAAGIEDTNIGWPLGDSSDGLDEYSVTQHYELWHHDLQLASDVGVDALRYGFPWYRVNPARDVWDWTWTDQVVSAANELGVGLMIDLVHYGTPRWLSGSFIDAEYPAAVAEFARQVTSRYRGRILAITPLNEPLVTASFTGMRGIWPPALTGEDGWSAVIVSIAEGIQASIAAIRRTAPELEILHVEATHLWATNDPDLTDEHALLNAKNYLPTDLVLGRVDKTHPLHGWLETHGIAPHRLDGLHAGAQFPDVIGLNYYPELSARELAQHDGTVVGVTFDGGAAGLESIAAGFHERYKLPLMISETAVEGSDDHRIAWLDEAVASIERMIASGIDVRGIVWWPLFDFVDWSWATGPLVIEEFYSRINGTISPIYPPDRADGLDAYFRRMGLCRLQTDGEHVRRIHTPAAAAFRRHSRAAT